MNSSRLAPTAIRSDRDVGEVLGVYFWLKNSLEIVVDKRVNLVSHQGLQKLCLAVRTHESGEELHGTVVAWRWDSSFQSTTCFRKRRPLWTEGQLLA
ncbi:MAG: hypothetical protein ABI382_08825 [Nakamurella sp.]